MNLPAQNLRSGRFAFPYAMPVVWVAWLTTLLASFAAGRLGDSWWSQARLDLRMLSCALLAVAAWIAWGQLRGALVSRSMFWVAIGMTLGFYGDSHVGDRIWWPPFPHAIVGGIVFYGLGHLAYIRSAVLAAREAGLRGGRAWWAPILAWQLVAIAAWAAVALTSKQQVDLRIPTLLYTLLVAATPGCATALALQLKSFAWMAIGGALFLASDVLLAWQLFHEPFPFVDEITWVCYGGGEMLIVFGAAHAYRRAPFGQPFVERAAATPSGGRQPPGA